LSSLLHALRFSVICDPIIISFNYDIFFWACRSDNTICSIP
jgi:hypothetical protein